MILTRRQMFALPIAAWEQKVGVGEIEQGKIARLPKHLQARPDGPDLAWS